MGRCFGAPRDFSSSDQDQFRNACRAACLHIGASITDENRPLEVNVVIGRCFQDHSGLRFTIVAFFAIGPDSILRMVRAEIVAIHSDVLSQELVCHPIHERVKISLRVELTRDSRLIGDDDERIPQCLGMSAKIEDAGCEFNLVSPIQIADFAINDSISI